MDGEHLPAAQSRGTSIPQSDDRQMQEVLSVAEQELNRLLEQRAQLTKRIGTVKQTILGLAKLSGKDLIIDNAKHLLNSKRGARASGLTDTCRMVLIEAERPLSVREICARIEKRIYPVLSRHKDPLASVTTVLNRLLRYGEVSAVASSDGGRVFHWTSETHGLAAHPPGQGVLIRPLAIGLSDDFLRRCAK